MPKNKLNKRPYLSVLVVLAILTAIPVTTYLVSSEGSTFLSFAKNPRSVFSLNSAKKTAALAVASVNKNPNMITSIPEEFKSAKPVSQVPKSVGKSGELLTTDLSSLDSKVKVAPNELIVMLKPNTTEIKKSYFFGFRSQALARKESVSYRDIDKRSLPKRIRDKVDNKELGISKIEKANVAFGGRTYYKITLAGNYNKFSSLRAVSDDLKKDSSIQAVAPNVVMQAFSVPNDPSFSSLWGIQKIEADKVWDTTTGSENIIVADIDTGIDYNHEDLITNMWVNASETTKHQSRLTDLNNNGSIDCSDLFKSQNSFVNDGIDDDGNGYVDDYCGWDFVSNDNNPVDDNGHGTHTAGTIAAIGNNNKGVVGVTWKTKVMALKFLNASGSGTLYNSLAAIDYAVVKRARVASNSYGALGATFQTLYDTALAAANNAGMVFVAAAGNDSGADTIDYLPTGAQESMSISASDSTDKIATFSNGGSKADVGAPGVAVLSTYPGNQYKAFNGTSMATPHVAGAAALILSLYPNLSAEQVRQAIRFGADDAGNAGRDYSFGFGRLNIRKSIDFIRSNTNVIAPKITTPRNFSLIDGTNYEIKGSVIGSNFSKYKLEYCCDPNGSWVLIKESTIQPSADQALGTINASNIASSNLTFRLTADDAFNRSYLYETYKIRTNSGPDVEPPTPAILYPPFNPFGDPYTGNLDVKYKVSDNRGVRYSYMYMRAYRQTAMQPYWREDLPKPYDGQTYSKILNMNQFPEHWYFTLGVYAEDFVNLKTVNEVPVIPVKNAIPNVADAQSPGLYFMNPPHAFPGAIEVPNKVVRVTTDVYDNVEPAGNYIYTSGDSYVWQSPDQKYRATYLTTNNIGGKIYYRDIDFSKFNVGTDLLLYANPVDTRANRGNTNYINLKIVAAVNNGDTIKPTVSIIDPVNDQTLPRTYKVRIQASDNNQVKNVRAFVGGSSFSYLMTQAPYEFTFTADSQYFPDGEYFLIRAISTDTAYNVSNPSDVFIKFGNVAPPPPPDTTSPTVNITSPANNSTLSGVATVTVAATDNVGVSDLKVSIDNIVVKNCGAVTSCSHSFDSNGYSNGTHTIKAEALDAANNTSSSSITVTVNNVVVPPPPPPVGDTTPPGVTISAPTNGSTVSGSVLINVSASDNVGVSALNILIDNTIIRECGAVTSCFRGWDTTSYTNGNHTVRAVASDAAGNTNSYTVSVNVSNVVAPPPPPSADTTPPTLTISSPANGSTVSGVNQIDVLASDNVGVTVLNISIDNIVIVNCGAVAVSCSHWWDTTAYSDGNHTIKAEAYDAANNKTTKTVSIIISNAVTPPSPPPPPTPSEPVEIDNMNDGDTVYGIPDPGYAPGSYVIGVSFNVNVDSTDYVLVGQQENGSGNFTTPCPSDCSRNAPFRVSLGGHISNSVNGWYNIYVGVFAKDGKVYNSPTLRVRLLPPVQGASDQNKQPLVLEVFDILKTLFLPF